MPDARIVHVAAGDPALTSLLEGAAARYSPGDFFSRLEKLRSAGVVGSRLAAAFAAFKAKKPEGKEDFCSFFEAQAERRANA